MNNSQPTLGQRLAEMVALQRPIENPDANEDSRRVAERRAVERFFEDAKEYIVYCITRNLRPAPIMLGSGANAINSGVAARAFQTYRWRHDAKVPPAGPHRDLWDAFAAWAKSQQLSVHFESDHDGVGVSSWYNLCVTPDQLQLGPPPDLAEGTVIVSKELLARFGSAQNYLEHLQKSAGLT